MQCYFPITIRNKKTSTSSDLSHIKIPCGNCEACVMRRLNGWSFRLREQMRHSETAVFMTMTYGEHFDRQTGEYLWGREPDTIDDYMTLNREHVLKFHKHLRRKYAPKLKYYTIGEYGGTNFRPHYHSIMFNLPEKIIQRSDIIQEKDWKHGTVQIDPCTHATIGYVAGYFYKGVGRGRQQVPIEEQFSTMSKGIGSTYLTPENLKWHHDNLDFTIRTEQGFKIPMPRYYRDKLFKEYPDLRPIYKNYYQKLTEDYDRDTLTPEHSKHADLRFALKIQRKNEKSI